MREVDIPQLEQEMRRGHATVVDVRERMEWAAGHVPGTVNIPMGQLPSRLAELPRDRPVLVLCQTGNRSGAMTQLLTAQGFDAANVAGGTTAWARSDRPLEKG